jgi:glucokinase
MMLRMDMLDRCYVVWDLGATKCAAAVVVVEQGTYTVLTSVVTFLRDETSLRSMAENLHARLQIDLRQVDGICIAAAGCYDGQMLHLASGYPFPMCFADVAREQLWPYFEVVHDYTPVVASTFVCQQKPSSVVMLRQGEVEECGRRVAFGIGTGLGLKDAVLTSSGGIWFGSNEVGHIGVIHPPLGNTEYAKCHADFMRFLALQTKRHHQPVTFETILSGQGFAHCYNFIASPGRDLSPQQVQALIDGGCVYRDEMLGLFAWYLGLFVGSLQLIFMPSGGIWMGGGVIKKNLSIFTSNVMDKFWAGVDSSPAYAEQRHKFPLGVMQADELIFMGGAFYAAQCFPVHEMGGVAHA